MKILGCPVPQVSNHTSVTELVFLCRGGSLSVPGMNWRQSLEKGNGQVSPIESLVLSQGTGRGPPMTVEWMEWEPERGWVRGYLSQISRCLQENRYSVCKGWAPGTHFQTRMYYVISFQASISESSCQQGYFLLSSERRIYPRPQPPSPSPPSPSTTQPWTWRFAYSHRALLGSVFVQISPFAKTSIILD